MTKTKAQRLKPVLHQAKASEQHAVEAFVEQQNILQQLNGKLQELYHYRSEYITIMKRENVQTTPIEMQQQRFFHNKINDAINFQQQQIKNQQQTIQTFKQKWLAARQKSGAYDVLIKSDEKQHLNNLLVNERKEQDDLSQHMRRP